MTPREYLQQNEPELLKYLELNTPKIIVEKILGAMDTYTESKIEGYRNLLEIYGTNK